MALISGWRGWLIVTATIGLTTFVVGRYYASNSAAFKAAQLDLRTNTLVIQKLGEVKSATLSKTGPSKLETGDGALNAKLSISLEGQKDSAEATVSLRKNGEDWNVVGAKLRRNDGTEIDLGP